MSPRTGRPPKGEQSRTQKITIRISDKEAQKIQECADKMDSTRTDAIMAGIDLHTGQSQPIDADWVDNMSAFEGRILTNQVAK